MKKLIGLLLAAVMLLSLAGCSSIDKLANAGDAKDSGSPTAGADSTPLSTEVNAATEIPSFTEPADTEAVSTEIPSFTEPPVETDVPAVTPAPADVKGSPDLCAELAAGRYYLLDVDYDGLKDTVAISSEELDYGDTAYTVSITRGAFPDKVYSYEIPYAYDFHCWVIDCDPTDSRLEVLFTYAQDSDDCTTVAMRVKDNGLTVDIFEGWFDVQASAMDSFSSEYGFEICGRTEIWGTSSIYADVTITKNGFTLLSDDYRYYEIRDWDYAIELHRSLDLIELNDDWSLGSPFTVSAGAKIVPVTTDTTSYVVVMTQDGRLGLAEVAVRSGDWEDWGIFINGINQDEYADIMYAD